MVNQKSVFKKILILGIPLFAGNFSKYLLQLADTIMVGRLGTAELASIAIAGLYCHILITFIWPLTTGVQALTARRFGRFNYLKEGLSGSDDADCKDISDEQNIKDNSDSCYTGEVLSSGLAGGLITGFAAFIVSFSSVFILDLLIDEKSLLPFALEYTNLLRWVFPIAGIGVVISGFLAGINMTFQIMIVTIGTNVLNIFFNYIFIFGRLGFPQLGVKGAALGTVLAEIIGTLYLVIYLLHEKKLISYRIFDFKQVKKNLIKDILKISSPIALQNMIAFAVFLMYESFIGTIGTVYLASTHFIFSVFRVNKTLVGGFARAGAILTGNYLGAENKVQAESIVKYCSVTGLFIGFFIVTAALLFPENIASVFTKDPETISITVKALRFFALFFFIEVSGYTFEIIFAGIGWSRFVLFSEFTTNMIFILFMTWLCVKVLNLGIYWGWLSFGLYQVFHALILTAGWISKRWLSVEVEKG